MAGYRHGGKDARRSRTSMANGCVDAAQVDEAVLWRGDSQRTDCIYFQYIHGKERAQKDTGGFGVYGVFS